VRSSAAAEKEGIAGYELLLNYNGVPIQAIARSSSEIKKSEPVQLVSVNAAEYKQNPCRGFVIQRGASWALTSHGKDFIDLLTY
jgi:hypothetical protein